LTNGTEARADFEAGYLARVETGMAGTVLVGIALGVVLAIVAYALGAGIGTGVAAYAGGGAAWLTLGLLPRRRRPQA
jgi:hypothetical protein